MKDYDSGSDFSQKEERSGDVTKGEYRTALPDGRIQIVSYIADHNGYKASVTYEGEPTYPPPLPHGSQYKLPGDVFAVFPDFPDKKAPLPLPLEAEPHSHPTPAPRPTYEPYHPPTPKPSYKTFRHSNKVVDPFRTEPYTKNGQIVGLDYDYYDYNDIYSSSKPTPKPTYETYKPPPPTPKPAYHSTPKPTYHSPSPKPAYNSYKPQSPKLYQPVNAYKPAHIVTTPIPLPVITTTPSSYAPPPPTPTYANAYSPSPSYTAPHQAVHPVTVQPISPNVPFRGLNFRNQPAPTESTFRGARKREIAASANKKSKLPTYPNFKPVYTTASSLLDYDYNEYDDYKEDSVTLPSRQNTVTATTSRPQITSTTTPTYYPTSPTAYTTRVTPTQRVTPSASGLLNSPNAFNTFTRTTTPPYTTNKLYITTPKPYYGGPWSPNYVEKNYDNDLNSSPTNITPSKIVGSSKSSKITTYRPNGFTPTSLKYKKNKLKNKQNTKESEYSKPNNVRSNTSSSSANQSGLGLDYSYDYYYDTALDYLQGRISQLNSKNNDNNNKHTNNRHNKHKS